MASKFRIWRFRADQHGAASWRFADIPHRNRPSLCLWYGQKESSLFMISSIRSTQRCRRGLAGYGLHRVAGSNPRDFNGGGHGRWRYESQREWQSVIVAQEETDRDGAGRRRAGSGPFPGIHSVEWTSATERVVERRSEQNLVEQRLSIVNGVVFLDFSTLKMSEWWRSTGSVKEPDETSPFWSVSRWTSGSLNEVLCTVNLPGSTPIVSPRNIWDVMVMKDIKYIVILTKVPLPVAGC